MQYLYYPVNREEPVDYRDLADEFEVKLPLSLLDEFEDLQIAFSLQPTERLLTQLWDHEVNRTVKEHVEKYFAMTPSFFYPM